MFSWLIYRRCIKCILSYPLFHFSRKLVMSSSYLPSKHLLHPQYKPQINYIHKVNIVGLINTLFIQRTHTYTHILILLDGHLKRPLDISVLTSKSLFRFPSAAPPTNRCTQLTYGSPLLQHRLARVSTWNDCSPQWVFILNFARNGRVLAHSQLVPSSPSVCQSYNSLTINVNIRTDGRTIVWIHLLFAHLDIWRTDKEMDRRTDTYFMHAHVINNLLSSEIV